MLLSTPVSALRFIGEEYSAKLEKLNIYTVGDLLNHYPFRYEDLSLIAPINSLQPGEKVTIQGQILSIKSSFIRGKTIQKAVFSDSHSTIEITWFNQPYLVTTLTKSPHVAITGTVKKFNGKTTISSPQYEILKTNTNSATSNYPQNTVHSGRLVPIYHATSGVSSKWLRSRIHAFLNNLPPQPEWLPQDVFTLQNNNPNTPLISFDSAIRHIHFPNSDADIKSSRYRLAFDELILYQLAAVIRKRSRQTANNVFTIKDLNLKPFIDNLPYTLTNAQASAISAVISDLSSSIPANRLIQGDVGAGKTAVAAAAMYLQKINGFQSLLMAPTEILANQHYQSLSALLGPLGCTVKLATSSNKQVVNDSDIVVGTHALLYRELPTHIGLVIIDEQHRFGVKHRSQLINTSPQPHLISMTATPIPRTIALTLYSELDISIIDELPKGRIPIKTWVLPESKRQGSYNWIKAQIHGGGQVFVVCPLIETSEDDELSDVKAAEVEFLHLQNTVFPEFKVGLIHGRMKSKDKDAAIKDFQANKTQILVATSVIEVGIDIPNATIMIIEGAERFGLSQLHQLRGRVGRNDIQSYCLLFSSTKSESSLKRLKYLETTHSGFELANIDLELRGPGDMYGTAQSGFLDLKLASLSDANLISTTHQAAIQTIDQDPTLKSHPLVSLRLQNLLENMTKPN